MAITQIDYQLIKQMSENGLFPKSPKVLEIGEANWYGDVPVDVLEEQIGKELPRDDLFAVAKEFYKHYLGYESITAIDLHGTENALRIDLNKYFDLDQMFDIIINSGTVEHVFNVFQCFDNIHRLCKVGGLMLHTVPFTGWLDHGFYNFNPTFFFDVAFANRYEIVVLLYSELNPAKIVQITEHEQIGRMDIAKESLLHCVYRKTDCINFQAPTQGVYEGNVSLQVQQAWKERRH